MSASRFLPILLLLALGTSTRAEDDSSLPVSGLNALPEVAFANLSQQDLNPLGAQALAIHPEQWKHGETEHFIYHFTRSYVATPVSIEAEFHYRVVAKELERAQPPGETKSHIYIFESAEDWAEFQKLGQLEKWTGGIHSAGSLFIKRDPKFRFSGNTLGHEIAHLVLHRFYSEGIPRWLDEGFAQYVSKGARASYERARGYIARPHSQAIALTELIPLPQLVALANVPNDHVETFYDESERLVRFLVATDKPTFLTLLDALGKHQPFEKAFLCIYTGRFASLPVFEERFREYAAKDAETQTTEAGN
ncbi:MAG: peptidase MA family metallohydrolase [Chthoniobacterales bacterium]